MKKEPDTSLVTFPCTFNFKAMLKSSTDATDIVTEIIQMIAHVDHDNIFSRSSKKSTYVSITVPTYLENENQMTQIYKRLHQHSKILMIL